jgi:hypothetical protein
MSEQRLLSDRMFDAGDDVSVFWAAEVAKLEAKLASVSRTEREWAEYGSKLPQPLGVFNVEADSVLALCLELRECLEGKR